MDLIGLKEIMLELRDKQKRTPDHPTPPLFLAHPDNCLTLRQCCWQKVSFVIYVPANQALKRSYPPELRQIDHFLPAN